MPHDRFSALGDSAVAFVGRPIFTDLTGGNYPQDNLVAENHCSGNGIYGKQSSFFFEAAAGHNTVRNNIAYNGPRAAVNFDDGGAGGSVVEGNLLFGHGRETSDHGGRGSHPPPTHAPRNTLTTDAVT
jgi:hypothetical protein